MSACTFYIFRLSILLSSAAAVSLITIPAAGKELIDAPVAGNSSKTTRASQGSPRSSAGSRDGQSSAWKQSGSRGWTASVSPRGPRNVRLVSATAKMKQDSLSGPVVPAPEPRASDKSEGDVNSGKSASADSTETAPAVTDVPPLPEVRPLTATERFKIALAEQRRALEELAAGNQSQDDSAEMQTPLQKTKKSLGLTATINADLYSDDPQKRETAERFQQLKEKLAKLKVRVQNAENPEDLKPQGPGIPEDHADASNPLAAPQHSEGEHAPEHTHEHDVALMPDEHEADSVESPGKHRDAKDSAPLPSKNHAVPEDEAHDEPEHQTNPDDQSSTPISEHPHAEGTENETHEASDSSDSKTQAVFSDKAVVDGPIDRIGLANNLYAVGEYRLAIDMYEHAGKTDLKPEQQIWSEYQAANCLRRLGKNGEASNRYRRLAGMSEAGWLSDQSRWWVEVLEQVRQLEKSLDSDADPTVKPGADHNSATRAAAPLHDSAHPTAPPTEDSHETSRKTTKEPSHGEHPE